MTFGRRRLAVNRSHAPYNKPLHPTSFVGG